MQIDQYLKAQITRNKLKLALNAALGKDLSTLLRDYGKDLNARLDKLLKDGGLTLTVSNLQKFIDDFVKNLLSTTEHRKGITAGKLLDIYDKSRATLDIRYPVEPQVLPKVIIDDRRIINEFNSIIQKYRSADITEQRMRRLLRTRLGVPAHQAFTAANTQIAGWDNAATKAIGDLAQLNEYWYHGPISDNTRQFCIDHVDGIYTEEEIRAMDNGQGLPVIRYVGGYNCMHELIPCDKNWSELKELI